MRLPRTLVADARPGERVRLCGWLDEVREGSVVLRDRTGRAELELAEAVAVAGLTLESAVEAVGALQPATPDRDLPLLAIERFEVVGPAAGPLPITDASSREERLDWRYLDLRTARNRLIFAVQTTAEQAMRAVCAEWGFLELHSPKLRPIPNKSGDQLFPVQYFDRKVYLAQSPQFYKQMAMAAGFDRVLEIAPVFRAQRDPTSRHDTEFTSVDVELAWIESEEDLMAFEEEFLQRVIGAVEAEHGAEVRHRFGVALHVPEAPFPRIPLPEAKRIVEAGGLPAGPVDEDLDSEGERRLAQHVAAEHGHEFAFITDYPDLSRPFYHMRRAPGTVETRSFDLLWKGLEITSGAQREHRHEPLTAQAAARGIPVEVIRPYLDFFKYGCPPHGGFGLGLTRMLMSMLELTDVREATYLFRGPDRVTP